MNEQECLAELAKVAQDEVFPQGSSALTVYLAVQVAVLAILHHNMKHTGNNNDTSYALYQTQCTFSYPTQKQ